MSTALKEDFELILKKLDQIHAKLESLEFIIEKQNEPYVYSGDETLQPHAPEIVASSFIHLK